MTHNYRDGAGDTRRHRRLPISSEAFLTLLRREDRAAIKTVRAIARDLSISGVRLTTQQVTHSEFEALQKPLPFADVELELPFVAKRVLVRSEIRWMRPFLPVRESESTRGFCVEMGLCWLEEDQDLASRISYAMDLVSASSSELRPSAEIRVQGIKLKKGP